MIRVMSVFVVLLALAGCSVTTKPDYLYQPQASDPVLVFNSDFDLHTLFYVNIDPASNYSCKTYRLAGYILHKDSIFVFDTPNKEFQISVPADQKVAVQALHSFSDGQYSSRCGPLYKSFTPQKGRTYLVKMNRTHDYCSLSISDLTDPRSPVLATSLTTCGK